MFVAGPLEYSSLKSAFNPDSDSIRSSKYEFRPPLKNSQKIPRGTAGRTDGAESAESN